VTETAAGEGPPEMRSDLPDVARLSQELQSLLQDATNAPAMAVQVSVGGGAHSMVRYRDLGVVVDDGAFQLYVGGEARAASRPGMLLGTPRGERELFEYAAAFVQLYLDESAAEENAAGFVHRVGLDYLQERIVKDPQGRDVLARLLVAAEGCICPRPPRPPKTTFN